VGYAPAATGGRSAATQAHTLQRKIRQPLLWDTAVMLLTVKQIQETIATGERLWGKKGRARPEAKAIRKAGGSLPKCSPFRLQPAYDCTGPSNTVN